VGKGFSARAKLNPGVISKGQAQAAFEFIACLRDLAYSWKEDMAKDERAAFFHASCPEAASSTAIGGMFHATSRELFFLKQDVEDAKDEGLKAKAKLEAHQRTLGFVPRLRNWWNLQWTGMRSDQMITDHLDEIELKEVTATYERERRAGNVPTLFTTQASKPEKAPVEQEHILPNQVNSVLGRTIGLLHALLAKTEPQECSVQSLLNASGAFAQRYGNVAPHVIKLLLKLYEGDNTQRTTCMPHIEMPCEPNRGCLRLVPGPIRATDIVGLRQSQKLLESAFAIAPEAASKTLQMLEALTQLHDINSGKLEQWAVAAHSQLSSQANKRSMVLAMVTDCTICLRIMSEQDVANMPVQCQNAILEQIFFVIKHSTNHDELHGAIRLLDLFFNILPTAITSVAPDSRSLKELQNKFREAFSCNSIVVCTCLAIMRASTRSCTMHSIPGNILQALPTSLDAPDLKEWTQMQEDGLYTKKELRELDTRMDINRWQTKALRWLTQLADRMQLLLKPELLETAYFVTDNLASAEQKTVQPFVEGACRVQVSDSGAERCNLEVAMLTRRFTQARVATASIQDVVTELGDRAYATGTSVLLTVTTGVHTTVRFIGFWDINVDTGIATSSQDFVILHVSVIGEPAKSGGASSQFNLLHATADIVLARKLNVVPKMQHGEVDTIKPASSSTGSEALRALVARSGLLTAPRLALSIAQLRQILHDVDISAWPPTELEGTVAPCPVPYVLKDDEEAIECVRGCMCSSMQAD